MNRLTMEQKQTIEKIKKSKNSVKPYNRKEKLDDMSPYVPKLTSITRMKTQLAADMEQKDKWLQLLDYICDYTPAD